MELYYNSGRSADVVKTIDLMKKNVDSRGDKTESIIERMEFVNVLQHMGNTTESGKICKEVFLIMYFNSSWKHSVLPLQILLVYKLFSLQLFSIIYKVMRKYMNNSNL